MNNIWYNEDKQEKYNSDDNSDTLSSGSLNMYGPRLHDYEKCLDTRSDDNDQENFLRIRTSPPIPYQLSRHYQHHQDQDQYQHQNDRPTWNEYFCEIVCATSRRSPCHRLQVGCILVKDNRIISQGYNGFLPGCPHRSIVRDGHEQATVHAEQNALCDCAKRGVSCDGSTAYITHYPCVICIRLLLASGISNIYYINDYKNDELVELLCNQKGVNIDKIE